MFNEPTVEDVVLASQHPVLTKLNTELANKTEENARLNTRIEALVNQVHSYATIVDRKQQKIDAVETFIKEKVEEEEIDIDIAQNIADLLGIELTKTIEIRMTFEATATVVVPFNSSEDIDSIASEFYADLRYGGLGDVESEDIEMTDWRDNS